MKFLLLIFTALLIILSCTSENKSADIDQPDLPVFPKHIQQKTKDIVYLDIEKFEKAGASIHAISKKQFEDSRSSEGQMLAEKFCKQSKGYQKGIWEGQNDCSWAVEKNILENLKDRAARIGDTLVLNFKNGEKNKFIHDRSKPNQAIYYQFKNYLQHIDFFIVEVIQTKKCRISTLINANDGTSFLLNGSLYFSNEQTTFLAASFNNEFPLRCTNKLSLYKFSDSQIEKIWHIPTGEWGVTAAKFVNQNEFLLEQSTTGIPSEFKRYAKVNATN